MLPWPFVSHTKSQTDSLKLTGKRCLPWVVGCCVQHIGSCFSSSCIYSNILSFLLLFFFFPNLRPFRGLQYFSSCFQREGRAGPSHLEDAVSKAAKRSLLIQLAQIHQGESGPLQGSSHCLAAQKKKPQKWKNRIFTISLCICKALFLQSHFSLPWQCCCLFTQTKRPHHAQILIVNRILNPLKSGINLQKDFFQGLFSMANLNLIPFPIRANFFAGE